MKSPRERNGVPASPMRIFLFTLSVIASPLHARIIHVPGDSSTVQGGINGAVDGDTVMVAQGTYHEHDIDFLGKAIRVTGADPEDSSTVAATIIDGDSLGTVFVFVSGEDHSSVLTGLMITGGNSMSGGGVLCRSLSAPTITKNNIEGNTAEYSGGGIYCDNSSPLISDNVIQGNSGTGIGSNGGGIFSYGSAPTISNNRIRDNSADGGGGIYCLESSPTITDNTIEKNRAQEMGGGIFCSDYSSPEITDNIISDNRVEGGNGGGGIACFIFSSPTIARNIITGNDGAMWGGGILCASSSPMISNNNITGNTALDGGGVYCFPGTIDRDSIERIGGPAPLLMNDIIAENTATYGKGGGLYSYNTSPVMRNCTIVNNSAYFEGGAIYCYHTSLTIVNSILWGNGTGEIGAAGQMPEPSHIAIRYSDIEGGQGSIRLEGDSSLDWGDGMLDGDPRFRSSNYDDFHLEATACGGNADSPCIDSGDPAIVDSLIDCFHGLGSNRSDMGTYGGAGEGPPVSITSGDNRRPVLIPRSFVLYQNYPNPFNPSTTIPFDIPQQADHASRVRLSVYDLRGWRVRVVIDSEFQPGSHKVVWNGRDERGELVPSGSYLYRMEAGNHKTTRKLTILK